MTDLIGVFVSFLTHRSRFIYLLQLLQRYWLLKGENILIVRYNCLWSRPQNEICTVKCATDGLVNNSEYKYTDEISWFFSISPLIFCNSLSKLYCFRSRDSCCISREFVIPVLRILFLGLPVPFCVTFHPIII